MFTAGRSVHCAGRSVNCCCEGFFISTMSSRSADADDDDNGLNFLDFTAMDENDIMSDNADDGREAENVATVNGVGAAKPKDWDARARSFLKKHSKTLRRIFVILGFYLISDKGLLKREGMKRSDRIWFFLVHTALRFLNPIEARGSWTWGGLGALAKYSIRYIW